LTDGELLRGAQQGDAAAWRALYQRALPAVWRQAYALVGDAHVAEDITSETMLALLKNIDRLQTDAPKIAGWLRIVVRCKAADYQRKVFRARDKMPAVADKYSNGRTSASPSAPLELEETRSEVLRVLDELPDRQRVVLEWKYLDALRVREIAERLGDSEKAVETVLYRARREFRRLFEAKRPGGVEVQAIHERGADFPQQSQS
jgi:RNA polymerase sigma-70 factor (ECF subfamily)